MDSKVWFRIHSLLHGMVFQVLDGGHSAEKRRIFDQASDSPFLPFRFRACFPKNFKFTAGNLYSDIPHIPLKYNARIY